MSTINITETAEIEYNEAVDPNVTNIIKNDLGFVQMDDVVETVYVNPIFPNNFLMNFYHGVLRYIAQRVPRQIKYMMVTTYQKGIERLHKEFLNNNDGDINAQHFPALILQPSSLKLDERINSVWHSVMPAAENIVRGKNTPIAQVGDLKLWQVPNRFISTFDVFYIGESYLEIMDMQLHMNRAFNNRYVYLRPVATTQIMLPDAVVNRLTELYNGKNLFELSQDIQLSMKLAYNRTNYSIPHNMNAHVKLLDSSDGSNYLGGTELPTYKVNFSFEAMFQLPNQLVIGYDSTAVALELSQSIVGSKDSIIDSNLLSLTNTEAILIHIYDEYPSTFTVAFNASNLESNTFKDFYATLTDIDTGVITKVDSDNFSYDYNETTKVYEFTLTGVPMNNVIDIIGQYSDEFIKAHGYDEITNDFDVFGNPIETTT